MDDIFDAISTYKSTDNPERINKGDAAERVKDFNKVEGDWCICRFIDGSSIGWPLHWMGDRSYTSFSITGPLGWSKSEPVAFFTHEQAQGIITEAKEHPKYVDRAVHKNDIVWRVLLTSSYDGSRIEVYRGNDYRLARGKFSEMTSIVEAAKHYYITAIFEGATRIG